MKRKTLEQFIQDSVNIHGDKYDYSQVEYINQRTKVDIVCENHGLFKQTPSDHLQGRGCYDCGIIISSLKKRKSSEKFIQESMDIHGDRYDYNNVVYIDAYTKIKIICKKHGLFEQKPNDHLQGCGCPKCGKLRSILNRTGKTKPSTTEEFINKANKIHNNKYDYSKAKYVNSKTKIKIICKKHGLFEQKPNNHLQGQGCPDCSCNISKLEKQWLESIGLFNDGEHRQVLLPMIDRLKKSVDGYNPETNTVYEFYGDFWHGNPNNKRLKKIKINEKCNKTFKQLYEETRIREQLIKDSGYNLIVMWESDWKICLSELKSARRNI